MNKFSLINVIKTTRALYKLPSKSSTYRCFSNTNPTDTGSDGLKNTTSTIKESPAETVITSPKLSGFAQAFERQATASQTTDQDSTSSPSNETFATLLRNSKFIDLGDPENKIVTGKIYHIVGDDLYIDFGWKFNCVCVRPQKNASDYVRNAKVRLRIKDLELSSRFLGSEKDLTILEADCQLLGITYTPERHQSM